MGTIIGDNYFLYRRLEPPIDLRKVFFQIIINYNKLDCHLVI